jgi:hypothetical protein
MADFYPVLYWMLAVVALFAWPLWRVRTHPRLTERERFLWGLACLLLPGIGFILFFVVRAGRPGHAVNMIRTA